MSYTVGKFQVLEEFTVNEDALKDFHNLPTLDAAEGETADQRQLDKGSEVVQRLIVPQSKVLHRHEFTPRKIASDTMFAPGELGVCGAYNGGYGNGVGGTMNVFSWISFTLVNWATNTEDDADQLGASIALWHFNGPGDGKGNPSLCWYQDISLAPGQIASAPFANAVQNAGEGWWQFSNTSTNPRAVVNASMHISPL